MSIDRRNDLIQTIVCIGMISHAPTRNYEGRTRPSADEDIGGKRPPGTDIEHKPPRPRIPFNPEIASSVKAWQDYEDELEAWKACYHRRTVQYFVEKLDRCYSNQAIDRLLQEARETLEAWQRTPIPAGQEPEYGSPQWKRWVAESPQDGGELARRFGVTRQYIYKIRKAYRLEAAIRPPAR